MKITHHPFILELFLAIHVYEMSKQRKNLIALWLSISIRD